MNRRGIDLGVALREVALPPIVIVKRMTRPKFQSRRTEMALREPVFDERFAKHAAGKHILVEIGRPNREVLAGQQRRARPRQQQRRDGQARSANRADFPIAPRLFGHPVDRVQAVLMRAPGVRVKSQILVLGSTKRPRAS